MTSISPPTTSNQTPQSWYQRFNSNIHNFGSYAYGLGKNAWNYVPSIPGKETANTVSRIANKVDDVLNKVDGVLNNPTHFTQGMTAGVLGAFTTPFPEEATKNPSVEMAKSLSDHVREMSCGFISTASEAILTTLLKNAALYEIDESDATFLKGLAITELETANQEQSTLEKAEKIWQILKKYHIMVNGVNLNVKSSSNEIMSDFRKKMEGTNNDGISPIYCLTACQEKYRSLRERYGLTPTSASCGISQSTKSLQLYDNATNHEFDIQTLEKETEKRVKAFAKKTVNYATMYAIQYISQDLDPDVLKQILQQGGDIQAAYSNHFKGIQKVCHSTAFQFIAWLIEPIIIPTIEQVVKHLRGFLNNEADFLHFIQKKVVDLSDYYGRIEKGRVNYLNKERRTDECGTFERFLEETIQVYGKQKFSKEDLIKIFGDYIVDHYVPSPNIELFGQRIPLISSFLEWLAHSIRKVIVRFVMEKSDIVQKMLTEGSNSVQYVHLELKKILTQELARVGRIIDQSRCQPLNELQPMGEKTTLISRGLESDIELHSTKLYRFIKTEACNGIDEKLADLDNPVSQLFSEVVAAIGLFKNDSLSIDQLLIDASTHAMKTALLALFENKDLETHLQTLFKVLEESYEYIPKEQKAEKEREFRQECADVDSKLKTLQEQISRTALEAALERHLKNASGERHQSIKDYVNREKELSIKFVQEIEKLANLLNQFGKEGNIPAIQFKSLLSQTISLIEQYLSHITFQLRSPELESCYHDVRGDLHNIYAATICELNQLYNEIEKMAIAFETIQIAENELEATYRSQNQLKQFPKDVNEESAQKFCKELKEKIPQSLRESLEPILENIHSQLLTLASGQASLANFNRREKLSPQLTHTLKRLERLKAAESHLKKLADFSLEFYDLRRKTRTPQTEHLISKRLDALKTLILEQIKILQSVPDAPFQQNVVSYLKEVKYIEHLHPIFDPLSIWNNDVPIYTAFDKLTTGLRNQAATLKNQIAILNPSSKNRQTIVDALHNTQLAIQEGLQEVVAQLNANEQTQQQKIKDLLGTIFEERGTAFYQRLPRLKELENHFEVKGCITVGELKVYHTIAPELIARIAPRIIEGTRTLIDALGKPFHYTQLILRLVLLHIAEQQPS